MPFYEAVLVDRIPTQSSGPTFTEIDRITILENVSWSKELNGDGFASVSTRPERLESNLKTRLLAPDENPMELWIYRDGVKVFAGPLIGIQVQGSNNTITFHSRGLLYYLRYMFLTADFTRAATDKFTVVGDLVDSWQDQDWGDFGIDTSGIGTSGDTIDVDYLRTAMVNIAQTISDLSNPDAANGFDFTIDPITRALVLYDPQRGSDKTGSVILDNRVLRGYSMFMDLTAGDFATTAIGAATGFQLDGGLWSQKTNTTRRDQFGLAAIGATWNNVDIQSTLDDFVQSTIDVHSNFAISFGGSGGASEGGTTRMAIVTGFAPDDIDPGDTISVTADLGFGEFNLQRDVASIIVKQGAEGDEEMSLNII